MRARTRACACALLVLLVLAAQSNAQVDPFSSYFKSNTTAKKQARAPLARARRELWRRISRALRSGTRALLLRVPLCVHPHAGACGRRCVAQRPDAELRRVCVHAVACCLLRRSMT
jgi:hypothetical protein